jgi:hypothetical protein
VPCKEKVRLVEAYDVAVQRYTFAVRMPRYSLHVYTLLEEEESLTLCFETKAECEFARLGLRHHTAAHGC